MPKRLLWVILVLGLLPLQGRAGPGGVSLDEYEKISQCVLVRERSSLAGQKVQLTGRFLGGSKFCHLIRKANIDTKDYICFALGEPCLVRLYLHKQHPQAEVLATLQNGDTVTGYGRFDYLGLDYNFIILDGIVVTTD